MTRALLALEATWQLVIVTAKYPYLSTLKQLTISFSLYFGICSLTAALSSTAGKKERSPIRTVKGNFI